MDYEEEPRNRKANEKNLLLKKNDHFDKKFKNNN